MSKIKNMQYFIKRDMTFLSRKVQENESYAWQWHMQITLAAQSEGLALDDSHRIASKAMFNLFGVDTSLNPNYDKAIPMAAWPFPS